MRLHSIHRYLYKFLKSKKVQLAGSPFNNLNICFGKSLLALRFFYLCCFVNGLYFMLTRWEGLSQQSLFEPQWVLWFLPWPESKYGMITLTILVYLLGSVVTIYQPFVRGFRFLVFLAIFYFNALENSDGHYSHYMYMMMYPTFIFIFFPNISQGPVKRSVKMQALTTFFGAQLSICVAYQMAGYSKVTELIRCLKDQGLNHCEVGANIMTRMAAMEHIQFRWPTFSGDFLYGFPWIGAILYYGIIWIHLVSLIIAFRPHMHRFFLTYRMAFHFGTLIFFGIGFLPNILAVCSVFALSPFYFKVPFLTVIKDLPPISWVFK